MANDNDLPKFLGGGTQRPPLPEAPSLPREPFPKYSKPQRPTGPTPTPDANAEHAAEITRIHRQGLFPKRA